MPVDRNRYSWISLRLGQLSVSLPCFKIVSGNILVFGVEAFDSGALGKEKPDVLGSGALPNSEGVAALGGKSCPNIEVVGALGPGAVPKPPNTEEVEVCPAEAFDTAGVAGAADPKDENRLVPVGAGVRAAWLVTLPARLLDLVAGAVSAEGIPKLPKD